MKMLDIRKFQEMSKAAFETDFDTWRLNPEPTILGGNLSYRIGESGSIFSTDKKVNLPNHYEDAFRKRYETSKEKEVFS